MRGLKNPPTSIKLLVQWYKSEDIVGLGHFIVLHLRVRIDGAEGFNFVLS
jgi:hypothetical protein